MENEYEGEEGLKAEVRTGGRGRGHVRGVGEAEELGGGWLRRDRSEVALS